MRPYQFALMFSTALIAQAAHAGEVTLYSGYDLSGRESIVRGDVGNLQSQGFNDRAMSLMVHAGRWEVCTDADFRGECRVFDAGPHRNLERFTNQISSLREIGAERGNRNEERGRGRGRNRGGEQSVMLFDSTDLRGRSIALRSDATTFVPLGFNDMTQSMLVRGGTWEFCQHSNFRGQCRTFGPGEYRNLDRAFHRAISSARQIGDGRERRGGYGQRDGYGDQRDGYGHQRDGYGDQRDGYANQRDGYANQRDGGSVELFTGQGFGGQRLAVNNEIRSLEDVNFNDSTASLVIQSGQWEFCEHADFRGQCQVLGPGRSDRLGMWQNTISSVRRVR